MSDFDTLFATGSASLLDETHGETGTYADPDGGTAQDVTVRIIEEAPTTIDGQQIELDAYHALVIVRTTVLTTAAKGGRFTVGSDTWTVVDPPRVTGGEWHCICKRSSSFAMQPRRTRHG